MLYGDTLRLPGEFLSPKSQPSCEDPMSYIARLKSKMAILSPTPTSYHGERKVFIHRDLASSTHVFLRHDSVKPTLQPPYDGPYEVIQPGPKYFRIRVHGKETTVSIDRLKPAHLLDGDIERPAQKPEEGSTSADPLEAAGPILQESATTTTRSGRRVHFPKKLAEYIP
ncbi:uncharacterized protein LOC124160402 [Ischnura elegans]|uniref:uncharacterized protein LOC124160402 n=1 Tax=Ischnura elegans TaxID=197161 RepID=UPI001ED899EB|nr:uncharacterized protein LOC124160402 [Ischnura elegans]